VFVSRRNDKAERPALAATVEHNGGIQVAGPRGTVSWSDGSLQRATSATYHRTPNRRCSETLTRVVQQLTDRALTVNAPA
jgi:hypothetical protein